MSPTPFTLLFATALVASLAVKLWLATRQMRHVAAHRAAVPLPFAGQVSLADHQRAADYTLAKGRFGLLVMAVGHGVLLGWTLLGGFDVLNNLLRDAVEPRFGAMAYQLALLSAFALIGGAIDLPFELYSTFRLEQRFGFYLLGVLLAFASFVPVFGFFAPALFSLAYTHYALAELDALRDAPIEGVVIASDAGTARIATEGRRT